MSPLMPRSMPRLLTRPVKILLFAAMAVCLPLTMASEAVALVYDGGVVGNEAGTAADLFGWLFAVAFLAVFLLAIYEQDRRMRRVRRLSASR
ncbi:MAG TPA: hypothetical protein VHL13_13640 [Pseudolabrys sp.]|nr:hypothetical protein [Pseudolabrys sp.]